MPIFRILKRLTFEFCKILKDQGWYGPLTGDFYCPDNASCSNNIGSYTCICNDGFEKDADGSLCADVDECLPGLHDCGVSGSYECKNTIGSHTCTPGKDFQT